MPAPPPLPPDPFYELMTKTAPFPSWLESGLMQVYGRTYKHKSPLLLFRKKDRGLNILAPKKPVYPIIREHVMQLPSIIHPL